LDPWFSCAEPKEQQLDHSIPSNDVDSITPDTEHKQETNDNNVAMPSSRNDASAPRRRWSTFYLSLLGPKFCYVYFIFILMKDVNDPNQRD
jgi:hypothetical protein